MVFRYFGGKSLGVSELINAYHQAVLLAITNATIVEQTTIKHHQIIVNFALENDVFTILKQHKQKVNQLLYGNQITITFEVRKSLVQLVLSHLKEKHGLKATFIN